MGYRLDITNKDKTIEYYGTKHYGYTFVDISGGLKYPSFKFLYAIGKFDDEPDTWLWDYGFDNYITLTAEEFETFIKLYAKEFDEIMERKYNEHYNLLEHEDIKALLEDTDDKELHWE